jgi:hypothetical protein
LIAQHNFDLKRDYRVTHSATDRFSVMCKVPDCLYRHSFRMHHDFFELATHIPHSCSILQHSNVKHKIARASQISKQENLKAWIKDVGPSVSTKQLETKLGENSIKTTQKILCKSLENLKSSVFASDAKQYSFVKSYLDAAATRGDYVMFEFPECTFNQIAVIYKVSIEIFKNFARYVFLSHR